MTPSGTEITKPPFITREMTEDILDLVGGDGPWQRRIFLVVVICSIPIASHNLVMSFYAPNLDHWCGRPPDSNWTVQEWKETGLPLNDPKCSRYKVDSIRYTPEKERNFSVNTEIIPCEFWEYDDSVYGSTVLHKFDMVCDREWFISLSKSIFIAGYLFSVMVSGYLADKFGRRPIIAVSYFIAVPAAISCAFSVSFLMFAISRFFVAVGVAGALNSGFVLLMEVIGPRYRSFYGLGVNAGWIIGYITLPGIVWLLKDWFWVQIVITIPCIILLSIWWLITESPRWLITHCKHEEAVDLLTAIAKTNGRTFTKEDKLILMETITNTSKANENSSVGFLQLFRTPGLWQRTLIVFYLWFVVAFMYYGLSYNTNELAGDPFINFAASGVIEIPAIILSMFVIRSLGRRNPTAMSLWMGGLACLLMYPIPEDNWWLSVSVSMCGKFFITCAFDILYVYTTELFPTIVRNIGLGSSSFCARLGSIIAPFVRELGHATHPVVPQIVFGILVAVGGFLTLFLPETNNCSVPDTFQEAIHVSRNKSLDSKTQKDVMLNELKKTGF